MPEEMSSELADRRLPAPVQLCRCRVIYHLQTRKYDPRLQTEILQQTLRVQLQQLIPLDLHPLLKESRQEFYL